MGYGTTRSLERMAAALGTLDGAPITFERVEDVPEGGVLCALPALLANGLLSGIDKPFTMAEGFYPIETIFLLLALMALARIPSLEALRYVVPGEWGKLLGLDRIPEVRTLRQKLGELCAPAGRAERWSGQLAREWMAAQPQSAGVYYADGHVRLYHGKLTALPRRYVARERLCLRGTTDYWVNALDGQPFFVVSRPADPGLLSVLREDVVPRLLAEAPGQPSEAVLAAEPLRSRFTLVFDREGYSPDFFLEMKQQRIAVLTYHKFPGPDWPVSEFVPREATLVHGEKVLLQLAERGVRLSNGLWVREVRHRCEKSGHQSAILCTDYLAELTRVAVAMFARWCQENFFKYMCQHFSLDRLVEYGTEALPDTTQVVNPAWRELDSQIRRHNGLLQRAGGRLWPPRVARRAGANGHGGLRTTKGRLTPVHRSPARPDCHAQNPAQSPAQAPADQGPARSGPFLTAARRQKALCRHHQTHCLPGRNGHGTDCPGEAGAFG
jgi:hypothetical protein